MDETKRIAAEIRSAQDSGSAIEPITSRIAGFTIGAAYQVAQHIHDARVADGASPVGRKIGFTNARVQSQYGVLAPIWGYVHDTTLIRLPSGDATYRIAHLAEPRIEPEIVLHFAETPPAGSDAATILACVDWVAHGYEIVRSIYPDWKFQAADAVAASGMHAALLLGEPQPVDRLGDDLLGALERFTLILSCDGQLRDSGTGANVLGNPVSAIVHLMSVLEEHAMPLQAGEMVTTGTITSAELIHPGETWRTEIAGIGLPGLSVTFT